MDFILKGLLPAFLQRRLIAIGARAIAGWLGVELADSQLEALLAAVFAAGPSLLNFVSYFTKITVRGFEPAMLSGLVGILAAIAAAAGAPIPEAVTAAAGASLAGLIATGLELWSSSTRNKFQPAGVLATPNP